MIVTVWPERAVLAAFIALAAASGCNALWGVDKLAYDRQPRGVGASTSTGMGGAAGAGGATSEGGASGAGDPGGAGGSGTKPECGDGVIEGDEQCDDGNDEPDDGCHQCDVQCDGPEEHEDPATHHCYSLSSVRTGWANARDGCISWGGHLASLTSAAENAFAKGLVTGDTWIGGNDISDEGTFEWVNGELWSYDDWGDGQPDNSDGEDCVEIRVPEIDWNDQDCGNNRYRLCERPPPEATDATP